MLIQQTLSAASANLVAEANHRIANGLALVSTLVLQRARAIRKRDRALEPDEVGALLGEVVGQLEAVGRLHRTLAATAGTEPVDVGIYLQQLAGDLVASLSRTMTLQSACDIGGRVPPVVALHLGMIVAELIANAVKYAHPSGIPGHIELRCHQGEHGVVVEVADDGVGLPDEFDAARGTSSGMRLVAEMAAQVRGTVEYRSNSLGLRCIVTVPRRSWPTSLAEVLSDPRNGGPDRLSSGS